MKTLEDQMSFYAAYHQDSRNKMTHFVGVPVIILALFIPLAWLRIPLGDFTLTGAMIFAGIVVAYYFVLDVPLALAMLVTTAFLVWAGAAIAQLGYQAGTVWFLILFIGGWALQLWGHIYEGRKPALVDNLFQIFVAPIFLAAEVFFALGYKPKLHEAVQKRALEMRARAGVKGSIQPGAASR
jgi:uncharacterized membrane protein YGL010W